MNGLVELLKPDQIGVLSEASTADHHTVLPNETMVVETNTTLVGNEW